MSNDYTEEREILDTKSMIEEDFFARLGKKFVPSSTPTSPTNTKLPPSPKYNTEKILLDLFEVRDGLIDTYAKIGINAHSQSITDGINKLGSCIKSLGGEVDRFDPFAHMSGLQAPNLRKSAKRVIENTVESYTLGKIGDTNISEDGKTIIVTFTGQSGTVDYKAVGTLTASKTWVGNEAIDYVYTPSEGRMSVKTFTEDSKWIDNSDNYKISWELFENEANFNVMPIEGENTQTKKEGKTKNNIEIKEEVENTALNNIEDEEIGDFPVEDKT